MLPRVVATMGATLRSRDSSSCKRSFGATMMTAVTATILTKTGHRLAVNNLVLSPAARGKKGTMSNMERKTLKMKNMGMRLTQWRTKISTTMKRMMAARRHPYQLRNQLPQPSRLIP